ncbi:hypothetical protein L1887_57764 [Cichorium endivia]|nr:hypothetical protein L1887_57764 [Cichorium endivia]
MQRLALGPCGRQDLGTPLGDAVAIDSSSFTSSDPLNSKHPSSVARRTQASEQVAAEHDPPDTVDRAPSHEPSGSALFPLAQTALCNHAAPSRCSLRSTSERLRPPCERSSISKARKLMWTAQDGWGPSNISARQRLASPSASTSNLRAKRSTLLSRLFPSQRRAVDSHASRV